MLRRCLPLLRFALPALVVAATWAAWRLLPERPRRSCSVAFNTASRFAEFIPGPNGTWTLVVPVDGLSSADLEQHVYWFDAAAAHIRAMPTPDRRPEWPPARAPDAAWWAWPDRAGVIHVVDLPRGRQLWETPPYEGRQPFAQPPKASPDGRYLLVPAADAGPIDIWEVATGTKRASLGRLGGELMSWAFDGRGRLRLACRDATSSRACVAVYQVPDGQPKVQFDIPCDSRHVAFFPDDGRFVGVGGPTGEAWWDMTVTPPEQLPGKPERREVQATTDGRFRVTVVGDLRSNWFLYEPAVGGTVVSADAFGVSDGGYTVPRTPAFSPDERCFLLARDSFPAPPGWAPGWLAREGMRRGVWGKATEILLCDPSTGALLRQFPDLDLALWSEGNGCVWTYQPLPHPGGITFREWPLAPPGPPWWLWAVTAAVGAWYGRGRLRAVVGRRADGPAA
jgi:hypothetical protein